MEAAQVPISRWVDETTMGHVHNEILLSHNKEEDNFTLCNSMDGPGENYAKWNKPVRERQIPYDFTQMWNLMHKINKQNRSRLRYKEQTAGCRRGGGLQGWVKKVKGLREKTQTQTTAWGLPKGKRVGEAEEHMWWRVNCDRRDLTLGGAHNTIYRWCIIELYTSWNLYNFINQCYPNKFNLKIKFKKTPTQQKVGPENRSRETAFGDTIENLDLVMLEAHLNPWNSWYALRLNPTGDVSLSLGTRNN